MVGESVMNKEIKQKLKEARLKLIEVQEIIRPLDERYKIIDEIVAPLEDMIKEIKE